MKYIGLATIVIWLAGFVFVAWQARNAGRYCERDFNGFDCRGDRCTCKAK